MLLRDKVLKYLPKKYYDRFGDIEAADDLIDNCIYIVYTSNEYIFEDGGNSLPCRSIKDAVDFIKYSTIKRA